MKMARTKRCLLRSAALGDPSWRLRYAGAVLNLYSELEALARSFDQAGVPWALCGGMALAVHGHPRATKDIDVIVRPEDVELAKKVARSCGFTLTSLPIKFAASGVEMERVSKIVGQELLMLDLLLANDVLLPVWEDRRRLPWRSGELPVVSRGGLISMKLAAGRPQDLADLAKLQESE